MNKKLQVFVSSTYTDLIEERQGAVKAILDAGHIPAGMELFKAGKSQMQTIHKWIDDSDVYMLILGGRYGSIEEESGLSYTELEYKYALSKDMPVFAIILKESFLFIKAAADGKDTIFEKDNPDKYALFKEFVENTVVKFANNIDQISTIVHSQLNDLINDEKSNLVGWTRQYNSSDTKYIDLISENKSLKQRLQQMQNELNHCEAFKQNEISKVKQEYLDLFTKSPKEIPYSLLESGLSSINIIYMEIKYTALDFFKMQYIRKLDYNCQISKQRICGFIQEDTFDKVFLIFEKYGLVTRLKHKNFNLYIFNLSNRGIEFCKYLCSN